MKKSLFIQEKYLDAFIKTAQYLASLTSQQDAWSEIGKVMINFFGADLAGFAEHRKDGEIAGHHWILPDKIPTESIFTVKTKEIVAEVLESSFLATHQINTPEEYSIAILPVSRKNQTIGVMLVGHRISEPLPKELLNVYLSVAGLAGTTIAKLAGDEALRESEEKFRSISASAQDAIIMMDNEGSITLWNNAAERIFGYKSEEVVNRELHTFLPPIKYREAFQKGFLKYKKTGLGPVVGKTLELSALRKDGTEFPVELSMTSVKLKGKWNAIGTLRDITERKRIEDALQESEQRYRVITEASLQGTYQVDAKGRITFANLATAELTGYSLEELDGLLLNTLFPPGESKAISDADVLLLRSGTPIVGENTLTRKDGSRIETYFSYAPLHDDSGEYTGFVGSILDITERKRTEEQKLALERQVLHAQKLESLGVLAGGIAHDFNNLLMSILGNADLALHGLSPMSPVRRNLKEIEKVSRRAAELAKQMLAYSGKGQFVIESINVSELVEEMAHLLEVSISKKALLKYNFDENPYTFDGDVIQIHQIIMNLIINASEAIGDKNGVIALSTGAMDCDRAYLDGINEVLQALLGEPLAEGIYVYLEVADTGCGMDAETIAKIFDPFFSTKFTGRGLGMSAVLGIVHGHKGAIKIHSEVGKGTTFRVLFPANELLNGDIADRWKEESEREEWRGSGTVLLIDDEETIRAVCKRMLQGMGFNVMTASDGCEALKVFGEHTDEIVCVLLDLTMPHMDGEEAFSEMQRLYPGVKVILCSGYHEQDVTQRFAGKGLAGFLQKPYNMSDLKRKLMDVLLADDGE